MKNVTIIIPSYSNDKYIEDLKNNLANQDFVYNISIQNQDDKSFAEKCNIGAMNAQTEYILFLNNDTLPEEGFVEKMLGSIKKKDEWAVSPMIIFHKTVVRHVIWENDIKHVFGVKDKVQCAGVEFNVQGMPYEFGRLKSQNDLSVKFRRRCLAVSGCCFLIKRDKFLELGGFDEEFINGWEDNDFMIRLLNAGGVCVYEPSAKIRHYFAGSEGRFDNEEKNYANFLKKWNGKNIGTIIEARKRL